MRDNYFIIHGSFGSPYSNWFNWLHDIITDDGKEVYVPQFPTGVGYQNYENWAKLLHYYNDIGTMFVENMALVFVATNDPYVKYEAEKDFADKVATEEILIQAGKHINSEAGYDTFEEIVNYL